MRRSSESALSRRRVLALAAGLPATLLLSACTSLPGQGPPPRLFRLTPKSTFGEDLPTVSWQLLIEAPVTPAGLNTTRIALMRGATELEYYARSSWTDVAPSMVQTLIVESFENSERIVAVGREAIGLRADFVLKVDLREFQAEYANAGPPEAHVRINGKLVRMPQRIIIGSRRFESVVPARADRLESIVQAFDEALGDTLKDLVEWTLTTGEIHARPA
ncbi:MAG: ABC-type transport auxiliary lipoprotein family protein [Alphaproteobacteria bacterium]